MDKLIGLKRIKENAQSEIQIICDTLVQILKPIVESPNDTSRRSVQLDSLENLMSLNGGIETLFEIGFIEVFNFTYKKIKKVKSIKVLL